MTKDQELNEAVARKLGWHFAEDKVSGDHWHEPNEKQTGGYCHDSVPNYSTDISAAWEIVEKMSEEICFVLIRYQDGWLCDLGHEYDEPDISRADTVPMAICLAFLKLP